MAEIVTRCPSKASHYHVGEKCYYDPEHKVSNSAPRVGLYAPIIDTVTIRKPETMAYLIKMVNRHNENTARANRKNAR
jgi:hypothetical protein